MSLSQSFSQKIGNVRPLNPCPSLDIDFVNGGYVTDLGFANQASVGSANFNIGSFNGADPVFTRASAATFRGSNGLIQYAPENLFKYSEQFDNSSVWNATGISPLSNQIESPSGTVSADKLTTSGTATTQRIGYNIPQKGLLTYSIYIKAGTTSFVQISHGSSANVYANFNVSTGVAGNVGSLATSSITSVGNGWYRCVVSATVASTSSWFLYIVQSNTAAYGAAFSATVANLYAWGAQLERHGSARAYISTTATERYGPRFEYDVNGDPMGLLMEEQSVNLVFPSDILTTQTRTVTAAPHTLSFYGTGSVSLSGVHSATVNGSGANTRTVYTFTPTAGSLTLTVSGTVVSAQLESRPFVTSYIPTVSGSVTRSADTLTSTVGAWYNNNEGSFVVRGDRLHSPTLNAAAIDSLFEMTNATTLSHAHYGDGSSESYVVDDQLAVVSSASAAGINVEFAFGASYSIATDDISVALDGAVLSAAYAGTITAPNSLTIGFTSWTGTNAYWNGHIKSFRYYPKALPDKIGTYTS